MFDWSRQLWARALYVGDAFGKLAALIALPIALVTGWAFFGELWDRITPPDLTAQMPSVEFRCAIALQSDAEIKAFNKDYGTYCGHQNLAVSLELSMLNSDRIARSISQLRAEIELPPGLASGLESNIIHLDLVRLVKHSVVNQVVDIRLEPWSAIHLAAGEQRPVELMFSALAADSQVKFNTLTDLLLDDPSPWLDAPITVRVYARIGSETHTADEIAVCVSRVKKAKLGRLRQDLLSSELIAIVNLCEARAVS